MDSAGAGDPGEPEDVGSQCLLRVRVEYPGCGLRSHWCTGMSLGHGWDGAGWGKKVGQHSPLARLATGVGSPLHVCGDVEAAEKYNILKIHDAKGKSNQCCIKWLSFCSPELLDTYFVFGHLFSAKVQEPASLVTHSRRSGVLDPQGPTSPWSCGKQVLPPLPYPEHPRPESPEELSSLVPGLCGDGKGLHFLGCLKPPLPSGPRKG